MIVECTRGFGLVEHPKTGEDIDVQEPFETDEETFELLDEHYPGFRVVEAEEPSDGAEDEDAEPECGVNGCSRTVPTPEASCWQHG